MRISQLAERTGVPASTLRFYEAAGLLPAGRTDAGYRIYGSDAVQRLAFIHGAKLLGLPLEEIAELLAVWESGACAQVKADLRPRIAARLAGAEARMAESAAFAATLRGALAQVDALPDRDQPCDAQCGFLAPAPSPSAEANAERWRTAPVACTLSGDGTRARAAQWQNLLDGAVRTPIPEGLRLTVPADHAAAIAALAVAEQSCCSFFDFRLHLDGTRAHLEVRAPASGAHLLNALFAAPA